MADWAIVIGVDKYWVPEACLKGAVRDALAMRQWLIETARVPEDNITLLVQPDAVTVPDGIAYETPTHANIIQAINTLLAKSGSRGGRLFFHYSGHGLTVRKNYSDENALLCSDFTSDIPTLSLSLSSIFEFFAATDFAEQFFFIDACRNVPWPGEFRVGELPWARRRDPSKPPVQQFVVFATSPGVKAAEERAETGNERGAFTSSLLSGLRGVGKAKAWDLRNEEYVVRFNRLFDFVVEDVLRKQQNVGERGKRLFQQPRKTGECGSENGNDPVLARFAEDAFENETLRVHIEPFDASAAHMVVVQREEASIEVKEDITDVPIEFQLRPKEYRVRSRANGFSEKEKKGWWVELWGPQELRVELVAGTFNVEADRLTRALPVSEDVRDTSPWSVNIDLGIASEGRIVRGRIELYSQDELAPLELYDSSGNLVTHGNGYLRQAVPPGIYRGVLRLPGAQPVTVAITVDEDETRQVAVDAPSPSPAVAELILSEEYHVEDDNTVLVSSTSDVGPIAGVQLSTILAMAGGVSLTDPNDLDAYHLRKLGLQTFQTTMPEEASGVMLLVADEAAPANLVKARVRFWPIDDLASESHPLLPIKPNIGEYAEAVAPGSYWLAVETPEDPPLVSAVTIPSRRVCMIVLTRGSDGHIQMFEYLPLTSGGGTAHPRYLRRLEMMQQLYKEGTLERAYQLVELEFVEPIASCLGGYMLLRLGRAREMETVARNMTTHFPELSDSWIIKAEYDLANGRAMEARSAYRTALDRGVPLVAEGVARLRDASDQFGIDHHRRPLLNRIWDNRVRSLIWTSWLPVPVIEGERLTG